MPPLVIPPLVKFALGAAGAAALVHWAAKEARRWRDELDRVKVRAVDPLARDDLPMLRRDPATGEWRVM